MNPSRKATYKERLEELKTQPKKSLGQNFLIDDFVIERILEAVKKFEPANIVEVGPGLGALTDGLINMQVGLTLIEMDREFSKLWREREQNLIEHDALKLDWEEQFGSEDFLLVSNLPYQISASIVMDRSLGPDSMQGAVLMFQKEVAERIQAEEGGKDYGLLSIVSQTFWETWKVADVAPGCFYPAPKVSSRVLAFKRKSPPEAIDNNRKAFLSLVKVAFAQRRKMLVKNLSGAMNGKSKDDLIEFMKTLELDEKVRPEQVSVEQFQQLFAWLHDL